MGPDISAFDILAFCGALLLVGALLGIGCNAGCGYVRRHVDIGWTP